MMKVELSEEELIAVLDGYRTGIHAQWNELEANLRGAYSSECAASVIGSLLARQVSLALAFTNSISLWDVHLGPSVLRTMFEINIKAAWLATEPDKHSLQYIAHSLAEVEAWASEIVKVESVGERDTRAAKRVIDWSARQQQHFGAVPKFDNADLRDVARKLGSDALMKYRELYILLSSCTHSTWNHIARVNMVSTSNPLHRFVRVPHNPIYKPEFGYLLTASDYCSQLMDQLSSAYKVHQSRNSHAELLAQLQALAQEQQS